MPKWWARGRIAAVGGGEGVRAGDHPSPSLLDPPDGGKSALGAFPVPPAQPLEIHVVRARLAAAPLLCLEDGPDARIRVPAEALDNLQRCARVRRYAAAHAELRVVPEAMEII